MMKMFIKIVVSKWEALKNLSRQRVTYIVPRYMYSHQCYLLLHFDVEFTCTRTSAKNFLLDSLLKLKTNCLKQSIPPIAPLTFLKEWPSCS